MDHLRRENLVPERFLPQIFSILRLYGGSSKKFKLDIWEVDEFYLESKLSRMLIVVFLNLSVVSRSILGRNTGWFTVAGGPSLLPCTSISAVAGPKLAT
jgi:hypothetical protein